MVFPYGDAEIAHLSRKDKRLGEAIGRIGLIRRAVYPDMFPAFVWSVVGQQISAKARQTVWSRMMDCFGPLTPERIADCAAEDLQSCGITMKKAGYIKNAAEEIVSGRLDLTALAALPDDAVCQRLSALKGVGVWTAEMLMLFSMYRPNILSYNDLAIHRGMRMLYRHREIDRERFERYRRRYAPYGSVASLYLWEIASGRHAEYSEP